MSTETAETRSPKARRRDERQIAGIRSALKRLPARPKPDAPRPARDVVIELAPDLLAKREEGYTWEEIHEVLTKGKVDVSIDTMKRYLQPSRGLKPTERRERNLPIPGDDVPADERRAAKAPARKETGVEAPAATNAVAEMPRPTLAATGKSRRNTAQKRAIDEAWRAGKAPRKGRAKAAAKTAEKDTQANA